MSASTAVRSIICVADEWQTIRAQVLKIKHELNTGLKGSDQKTIFYDILTSDQMSPQDKETERLVGEGLSVVAAGYLDFPMPYAIQSLWLMRNT